MRGIPKGWHEQASGELVCPHRDVSVCYLCAAAHEEVVKVYGQHFWIADPKERQDCRETLAALEPLPRKT